MAFVRPMWIRSWMQGWAWCFMCVIPATQEVEAGFWVWGQPRQSWGEPVSKTKHKQKGCSSSGSRFVYHVQGPGSISITKNKESWVQFVDSSACSSYVLGTVPATQEAPKGLNGSAWAVNNHISAPSTYEFCWSAQGHVTECQIGTRKLFKKSFLI
jgi:hypothetical protein